MRLLFDQNLAWRLVRSLADLYPDSLHVRDVGLASADDLAVWEYAKQNALTIAIQGWRFSSAQLLVRSPTQGDLDQTRKLLDDDHRAHASRPPR